MRGDGAEWIWNLADPYFPGATQIVDLYHARQHLWELARKLHPHDESGQNRWMMIHQDLLDNCKIKKLVTSLRSSQTSSAELAEKLRTEAEYFRRNARRMRYPKFRRQHLFVGTGVIEAGCKTLIGSRCKQPGLFWTVRGANAILALRCCQFNGEFEDYWEASWRETSQGSANGVSTVSSSGRLMTASEGGGPRGRADRAMTGRGVWQNQRVAKKSQASHDNLRVREKPKVWFSIRFGPKKSTLRCEAARVD